jgi:signal transduction histidine kinase
MTRRFYMLAQILALAAIYFAAGKSGLSLAFGNASVSAVWPPTGIALAALLLWGQRLWPGIFLGAFVVNITTQASVATSFGIEVVATSFGIAVGNTLEAALAAHLVLRFAGGLKVFERAHTIFIYVLLAAILSTTLSATFGVTSLCLGGFEKWARFFPVWLTWWLGDMTSNLIVAPLLVIWLTEPLPKFRLEKILEGAGLFASVIFAGQIVFVGRNPFSGANLPLEYFGLLPLLWAAFRFGKRGAVMAAFVMSGIALWGTLCGLGPFARPDANVSLLLLQAFVGTSTLTALVLAAVVAERKDAEARLARVNEDLERRVQERTAELKVANSQLEDFVYSIAHDLRAPLRSMHGFSKMLVEENAAKLGATGADLARRIARSAEAMDALLLDLLAYGRVARSEMTLNPVDAQAAWSSAVAQYEQEIQEKKALVEVVTPLPRVLAHEATLGQAFANLLGNALKFVAPGVAPHIRLRAEDRSGLARFWVEDNGIGIESQHHERVFRIFEQLNGKQYRGTGIGLSIVRKGIERMGGRAGLESALGEGSRFWIELRKI